MQREYTYVEEPKESWEPRHKLRVELEPELYEELQHRYSEKLNAFWESASFQKNAPNTVCVIERRCHPNLEFVIKNCMYFATKSAPFSLTLVCSKQNEEYLRTIVGKHSETTNWIVAFDTNPGYEQARIDYNRFLTSPELYEQISADYILTAQTDCWLRKPLPPVLWTLDYCAAFWVWQPNDVGGGGLTWRKRSTVLQMCKTRKNINTPEDVYFSQMCRFMESKTLPYEEGADIFCESVLCEDAVGVHQWWTYAGQEIPDTYGYWREIYLTLDMD